ncbi:hypothetical protein BB561_006596 [Smittium simulii]|uniref:Uncharacterized protein n=1 Tax=Smittium simulii TaxID=133385 RepID=A0A2T9Y325_9FUNG|nr:hypothetical protein BB561_006596 [Smittium simulii]
MHRLLVLISASFILFKNSIAESGFKITETTNTELFLKCIRVNNGTPNGWFSSGDLRCSCCEDGSFECPDPDFDYSRDTDTEETSDIYYKKCLNRYNPNGIAFKINDAPCFCHKNGVFVCEPTYK